MRQLRLLGLAVVAMFSLGIAMTSAAQAVELKFLPEKATFAFKSIGSTKLVTLSGKEVTCTGVTGTGEGVSERLGKVEFKFTGCKGPLNVACTGLSDTTEKITVTGEYHLRHLLGSSAVDLAILVPAAHFSCLGILFVVKGCVASADLLTKEAGESIVGKEVATIFTEFKNENPVSIDTDNSLGMEACELKSKEGSSAEETSGQVGKGEIEKCELAKVACKFKVDLSGTP